MTQYIAKKPDQHGIIPFTVEENETWKILFDRQMQTIQHRACDEFLYYLAELDLPRDCVPQCPEVSQKLMQKTGWSIVPVPAIIPLQEFFQLLSERKFPAASFIRIREELDYLEEPDIFHEIFGHCPLLLWEPYADLMQRFGQVALHAEPEVQSIFGRLFWFTIEFGLINTKKGARVYGAGILSSHEETQFSIESVEPKRLPFDATETLKTEYRYDVIQKLYFMLNDFSDLFSLDLNALLKIATQIAEKPFHENDFITC